MGSRLVLACVLLGSRLATAQPAPWAAGISDADQAKAMELAAAGDERLAARDAAGAVIQFEAALALWENPVIQFKLATAEIQQDHMVQAADALDRALRFGAAPFTEEQHAQAISYQRLLETRVGNIAASCTTAGLEVALDGTPWITCPREQTRRVAAGAHTIRATARGYEGQTQTINVAGGGTLSLNLEGLTIDEAYELRYRFPTWIPWATLGTGLALGTGGVLLWLSGSSRYDEYDQWIATMCAVNGCSQQDIEPVAGLRDSARQRVTLGTIGMISGSVGVIGGIVLYFLNEPTRYRVDVAPTAGGATASASVRF